MERDVSSFTGNAMANRRTAVAMPNAILGSLRWPGRPDLPEGNPCWTYMVDGELEQYAVAIGHVENGRRVWSSCVKVP